MARVALTTSWSEDASAVTGVFVQNLGENPILLAAVAAADAAPLDIVEVGFVLQAGDFLPLSGLASSDIHMRTFSGAGVAEILELA